MKQKKILFLSPYPFGKAASQRLKYEQYYEHFKSNGFELETSSFIDDKFWKIIYKPGHLLDKMTGTVRGYVRRFFDLFRLRRYDIVYIHLWATPLGPPIFEWIIHKLAKKIVYDIDDMIFLGNTSDTNSWVAGIKGNNKPIFLIKKATIVITTTPYLVKFCLKYNQNVFAIPPSLSEEKYFPMEKTNKKLTIGWIGSHSTENYLEIVKPALTDLAKEVEFTLELTGAEEFSSLDFEVKKNKWADNLENDFLNNIDIALYPLNSETWSEGKFGGKLVQYFAVGLPCIASDVNESNRVVIKNKINGILIDNDKQSWLNALRLLCNDIELRKKIGREARKDFLEKYSTKTISNTYLQVLLETLKK